MITIDKSDNIYVCGLFESVNGLEASNVAKYNNDTQAWQALGSGIQRKGHPTYPYSCYCLTLSPCETVLYVGGYFQQAGSQLASNVAKWDGTQWHALNGGIGEVVHSLATDKEGNLYAGGWFTNAAKTPTRCVAKWDGTSWKELGHDSRDMSVYAMALDSAGSLYVGGMCPDIGACILKWNGSRWVALGHFRGRVNALVVNKKDELFVGGAFHEVRAGGIDWKTAHNIAKWNGKEWSEVDFDARDFDGRYTATVTALALDKNDDLHAVVNYGKAFARSLVIKLRGIEYDAGCAKVSTTILTENGDCGSVTTGQVLATTTNYETPVRGMCFDSKNNLHLSTVRCISKLVGTQVTTLGVLE